MAHLAILILAVFALVFFVLQVLLPAFRFLRKSQKISRLLTAGFPQYYEGQFHWIYGNLHKMPGFETEEGLLAYIKNAERHPRAGIFYLTSLLPILYLTHPETVKQAYKASTRKPGMTPKIVGGWLGEGLFTSEGEKWFRNRKLLTPAFHFDILKRYVRIFNACADDFLMYLQSTWEDEKSIEIQSTLSPRMLQAILKCAFSAKGSVSFDVAGYLQDMNTLAKIMIARISNPLTLLSNTLFSMTEDGREWKRICKKVREQAKEIIVERRAAIQVEETKDQDAQGGRQSRDFLDILLLAQDSDGQGLTDEEIVDEVETFRFAGHDTTKCGISFILYNLARYPEIQQRARGEVQALLEGRESDEIMWEDLSKMPYLTQCIKESLRLHPPATEVDKEIKEPVYIDGHLVPKGTQVNIVIWAVHHNPEVWGEDHMVYDPDRFSEERMADMDPFAFIPFSAGSRNCIGQNFAMNEMKIVVARILNKFQVVFDDSVKVVLEQRMVLGAKDGIFLKFSPLE